MAPEVRAGRAGEARQWRREACSQSSPGRLEPEGLLHHTQLRSNSYQVRVEGTHVPQRDSPGSRLRCASTLTSPSTAQAKACSHCIGTRSPVTALLGIHTPSSRGVEK